MRQVNATAEQELQHMFSKHGSHAAVCEALLEEADGMIEKMICKKETEAAYRESPAMKQSKAVVLPTPKSESLSKLIAEQAEELKEDASMPLAVDTFEEDEKPEMADEFTEEDFNRPEEVEESETEDVEEIE